MHANFTKPKKTVIKSFIQKILLQSLLQKYRKQNLVWRFFVNTIFLAAIWTLFYAFVRDLGFITVWYEKGVFWLTTALLYSSQLALEVFQQPSIVFAKMINILGYNGVYLDRGCLARNLQGLFAGFILAYPGNFKHKLWFIPAGLVIIFILNVARIAGLAYIQKCCPQHIDINHHVVFKYVVYAFIFLMWLFWIKKYSPKHQ